jgi:hypothetical protein
MAHDQNCAIALVDHHNKLGSTDAVAAILGSTAKGAIADTIWGLFRERGKSGARLVVTGRDIEERSLDLRFDGLTGCWQVEGETHALNPTERHRAILEALEDLGKSGLEDIREAIGWDKGNTYKYTQDLVNEGKVIKTGKGKGNVFYELPNT